MNNRFSALKSSRNYEEFKKSNNDRKNDTKNDTKEREKTKTNIFKQKSKIVAKTTKEQTDSNLFIKSKPKKELEFKLETENFPSLNLTPIPTITKQTNYLEKIKQTKEEKKETNPLPDGWIILKKDSTKIKLEKPIISEITEEIMQINPYSTQLILDNRRKYREELNEILGDISPYWDMSYAECDDDEYDIETDLGYSDEEEEYVEDW